MKMKTAFSAPAPSDRLAAESEDLTARNWGFQESSAMLLGERPPVALPRSVGELAPKVGIYCHASFQNTQLACFQGSEAARRQVREYIRTMGRLAIAAMNAQTPAPVEGEAQSSADMALVGVVLQLHDPTLASDQLLHPWEFHRIDNIESEEELHEAERALAALRLSGGDSGIGAATTAVASRAAAAADGRAQDDDDDDAPLFRANPHRLSLYTRHVARYTGVYPACVICVRGTAFKRDRQGRVTSLIVKQIFTPRRPEYPWESPAAPLNLGLSMRASMADRQGARVQFLSGPFPRNETTRIAAAVVKQATVRGANVVIICGPLVAPYGPDDQHHILRNTWSFADQLDQLLDALEEAIKASRNTITRFVLVPSVEDAVCFPVVPQPCFAISVGDVVQGEADGENEDERDDVSASRPGYEHTVEAKGLIQVASNPCEISICSGYNGSATDTDEERRRLAVGVRFGVTSFDSVSLLRDEMVERFPDGDGNSLHRVAETVLTSRLYVPLVSCPSPNHDLVHLHKVFIERNAVPVETGVHEAESGEQSAASDNRPRSTPCPPHVVFLPSIRPPFAIVSHTAHQDLSDPRGRGTLLINQGSWNPRQKGISFSLKIAEVTMTSIRAAALGGAIAENGVTVGTIEIFDSDM